jgi:hypothetical protein
VRWAMNASSTSRANVLLTFSCTNVRNPSGSLGGPPNPPLERAVIGLWLCAERLRTVRARGAHRALLGGRSTSR